MHSLLATLCAMTASINRGKGQQPTHPEDFMPWRERRRGRPRLSPVEVELTEGLKRIGAANRRKKGKA